MDEAFERASIAHKYFVRFPFSRAARPCPTISASAPPIYIAKNAESHSSWGFQRNLPDCDQVSLAFNPLAIPGWRFIETKGLFLGNMVNVWSQIRPAPSISLETQRLLHTSGARTYQTGSDRNCAFHATLHNGNQK
ncbi:hypothetical protein [Cohaesibacter sp. ES.047]|uniref:hypothetical protein n=1 Tax=Cohaesibacter sp. ES.047 TaxID=1798205 RepID=UPI0012FDDAB4|nr:hypothetical protein [Cohaesibacter sp. ES.047]